VAAQVRAHQGPDRHLIPHPRARPLALLLSLWVLALAPWLLGCSGHEARVRAAHQALDRGEPELAVAELNGELQVKSEKKLPKDLEGDNALLLLDRATVLQSIDRYGLSARDFGAADKAIEMLDLSSNAADDLGRYLFSDDVGRYRAPPFEKLLINSFNMMNYLAQGDLSGARVEARRLAVMQKYLSERDTSTSLLGLGSYLAGYTFERSGDRDEALLYYDEALSYQRYDSLRDPLRALTGGRPSRKRIDELVAGRSLPPVQQTGESELVVVVGYGRVPPKEPVRIPIGLALTLVSDAISPHDRAKANELAAKGLVTWINFPRLGKARGRYGIPELWVDDQPQPLEEAVNIESEVRREWEENEGTVILAAITRMIARIIAGEAVQAGTTAAAGGKDSKGAGILGLLAGLATSATMAAADTPDTRSWATLPARVAIARLRLRPGRRRVRVYARGRTRSYDVDLKPGGWSFIVMSSLR
jgi:tetratricopeptide (TPR) repeat protein